MSPIEQQSCPNQACHDYAKKNLGNISIRGKYGKNKDKPLLYCRSCGKRFAETQSSPIFGAHLSIEQIHQIIHHAAEGVGVRATARLLGLSKTTVNQVILKVGAHCVEIMTELMRSLQLTEVQLDELWTFVKKKLQKTKTKENVNLEKPGSGLL
jgi:transposase-like protein